MLAYGCRDDNLSKPRFLTAIAYALGTWFLGLAHREPIKFNEALDVQRNKTRPSENSSSRNCVLGTGKQGWLRKGAAVREVCKYNGNDPISGWYEDAYC